MSRQSPHSPHGHHHNIVLGPRGSKRDDWHGCPHQNRIFGPFWPQHPGRQLSGPLFSGQGNSSSGMLFWPKTIIHVIIPTLGHILGPEMTLQTLGPSLVRALLGSGKPLFCQFSSPGCRLFQDHVARALQVNGRRGFLATLGIDMHSNSIPQC